MRSLKTAPLYLSGIFLFAFFAIIALSCKDEEKSFTSDIVFPDSLVSFTKYVEPLFQQTCVDARCHGGSQPAANLYLENNMWNNLIDYQPSIIIVNNGDVSSLVKFLDGRLQPQMPIRKPLKQNQINGVKKWIDEGAQYN
jgi:hypothetical protein